MAIATAAVTLHFLLILIILPPHTQCSFLQPLSGPQQGDLFNIPKFRELPGIAGG